jgi:hypothetical protein
MFGRVGLVGDCNVQRVYFSVAECRILYESKINICSVEVGERVGAGNESGGQQVGELWKRTTAGGYTGRTSMKAPALFSCCGSYQITVDAPEWKEASGDTKQPAPLPSLHCNCTLLNKTSKASLLTVA